MVEILPCTDCDKVFTKAFELRKHKATHENPDSVFHCSECDFITLSKKSLTIHFAKHTGEKSYQCPDMISFPGPPAREERCDYRTNDPSSLSRHRQKIHGHIPLPSRSRSIKPTSGNPLQKVDDNVTCRPQRSRRPGPTSRRILSRALPKTASVLGYASNASGPPTADRDTMDVDYYDPTLVDADEEMDLDSVYDPSLRSDWMAEYENSYNTFDATGLKYHPEPAHTDPSLSLARRDMQTGREGCLCPEWMVEAGVWDQSVLERPRECYLLDA